MSSQQSISGQSSSSYKSTTVSITVHHQETIEDNGDDDDNPTTIPNLSSPQSQDNNQPFTTLIASEKSLHTRESNKHKVLESVNSVSNGSTIILLTSTEQGTSGEANYDSDERDQVECDQEINRITNNSSSSHHDMVINNGAAHVEQSNSQGGDGKVIIISSSGNLSPEPSGNLELVGLRMMRGGGVGGGEEVDGGHDVDELGAGGGVEFEEFVLGDDDDGDDGGDGVDLRFCVSSSSKTMMKSSSKSVQQQQSFSKSSSLQQQSSIEKLSSSSSMISKQEQQVESSSTSAAAEINQSNSVNSSQQSVVSTMTNGSGGMIEEGSGSAKEGAMKEGGKKTKVERKTSKAGKKSKSNAEISKENISVTTITNGTSNSSNQNNSNNIKPNNLTPFTSSDDLVKKFGPGESRVFAKVCVANLRRSFGDLTAINGAANNESANSCAPTTTTTTHNDDNGQLLNKKYNGSSTSLLLSGSSSLEYNRINNINMNGNSISNNDSLRELKYHNLKNNYPFHLHHPTNTLQTRRSSYDILNHGGGGGYGGPSSLPTSYSLTSINRQHHNGSYFTNANHNNAAKLQLFQPSYWEGLFCHNSSGSVSACDGGDAVVKKSSFSKFDSLVSKNQSSKKEPQENGDGNTDNGTKSKDQESGKAETKKMFCTSCEKQVFQMELIRAEKKDWHKNCFRCVTCRKVLGMDTYQSHEQRLYCKPHFKELFQPKKVVMEEDADGNEMTSGGIEDGMLLGSVASRNNKKSKLQLIICESQPKELPPDVVRASDAPTTGLEDIQIDVRSKFEMFENLKEQKTSGGNKSPVEGPAKRSASVLAKLKKYENSVGSGGSELNGVSDEDLHGVDGIELQSDEDLEEYEGEEGGNSVIRDEIKRKLKNPLQALNEIAHFKQMEQVRSKWEEGTFTRDQINAEQRKEELQKFRSRLCQGKSGHLKEMYEKGMETGGEGVSAAMSEIEELKVDKAKAFREMFEKGDVGRRRFSGDEDGGEGVGADGEEEGDYPGIRGGRSGVDLEVFEAGITKESKRLFEEMDKKVVREMKEDKVSVSSSRFIEKKRNNSALVSGMQQQLAGTSPPTDIVRSSDKKDELVKVNTEELSSKFKFFETYEEDLAKKAKESKRETFKRITPPREDRVVKTGKDDEDSDSESQQTYRDPDVVRHGEVTEDPLQHSKTTSKMLSVFRQMEESLSKGEGGSTPIIRPLKQFTPPRDTVGSGLRDNNSDEEEEEEEEEDEEEGEEDDVDEGEKRMSEDDFLKEVGSLARARSLRAKFERWEQQENERNKQQGAIHDELAESIESAKNLKAKFEAMRLMGDGVGSSNNKENLKGNSPVPIRVNRFVLNTATNNQFISQQESNTNPSSASTSPHQLYCNNSFSSLPAGLSAAHHNTNGHIHHNNNNMSSNEQCAFCEKRVYVMEKIEAGGKMYHKNCFRCSQCKCILRMDTFTSNKGTLFCTTHFKQLFKIKGNYDEGFGHETQYAQWAKKHAASAATAQPN